MVLGYSLASSARASNFLLVKKESPIKDATELKGKKIATYPGSTMLVYAKLILSKYTNIDEVEILQLAPHLQIDALASGAADALLTIEPVASTAVEKGIGRILVEAPMNKHILDPMPGVIFCTSKRFAEQQPQVVERLLELLSDYAKRIQSLNKSTIDEAVAKWCAVGRSVAKRISIPEFRFGPEMNPQDVDPLMDLLAREGILKKPIKMSTMFVATHAN